MQPQGRAEISSRATGIVPGASVCPPAQEGVWVHEVGGGGCPPLTKRKQ